MKLSSILSVFVLCWLLCFTVQAQSISKDSLLKIYETETILLIDDKYEINGQKHKMGFHGGKLLLALDGSPEAQSEMEISTKHSKRGIGYIIAGLACAVAAVAIMDDTNLVPYYSLLGAELILAGLGFNQLDKSSRHKVKAVWLFNRDILIKKME